MIFDKHNNRLVSFDSVYKNSGDGMGNPVIKFVGVGGAGCHTVGRIKTKYEDKLKEIITVIMNTDRQDLNNCFADIKVQIGVETTKGRGAGTNPVVGFNSAMENVEDIRKVLEGTDLLFLTAGMGGGTGTGAAPIVAKIAKEMNILTIAMVITPSKNQGKYCENNAEKGLMELKKYADTVTVVSNSKVQDTFKAETTRVFYDGVDDIIYNSLMAVSDILLNVGEVNQDFADLTMVVKGAGNLHIGIGNAKGKGALFEATKRALENPIIDTRINGAKSIMVNVKGLEDRIIIREVNECSEMINQLVDPVCKSVATGIRYCTLNDKDVEVIIIAGSFNENVDLNENNDDYDFDDDLYENKNNDSKIEDNIDKLIPDYLQR